MKAIIIDDAIDGARSLETLIHQYCPAIKVVASETSPSKAISLIEKHHPDVIFLDIQMTDMSGFTLLEKVSHIPVNVIFMSAYIDYAIRALRQNAVDYLLKPIMVTDLIEAAERLVRRAKEKQVVVAQQLLDKLEHKSSTLAVNTLSEIIYMEVDRIIRLEADSNYTNIVLNNGKTLVTSRTLKEYEELLDGRSFFRVFKTYLIHLKYVDRFVKSEGGYIVMSDGTQIPVSRDKRQELLDRLMRR